MKYVLPKKLGERKLEIDGLGTYNLKFSFSEKMDFIQKMQSYDLKNKNGKMIENVIRESLPKPWSDTILGTGDIEFITNIFIEIVSTIMGMTPEEYTKKFSEKK